MKGILRILAIVVGVCVLQLQCGHGPLEKGDVAPEFCLKNIDGKDIRLSDFRGKIVLVQFWADCCSGFTTAFPEMQSAYEKLHERNLEILAVNAGEPRNIPAYYDNQYDITFPMLVDETADVAIAYGLKSIPAGFIISARGTIIDILFDWPSEEYLRNILDQERQIGKEG